MNKHLITQAFGENDNVIVSMIDNVEAGTSSDTTTVLIKANKQTRSLDVSLVPSEYELQGMAEWVERTIKHLVVDVAGNDLLRLSERIHLYLQQAITFKAQVAITSNKVDTDIEWIRLNFEGQKRRSDGRYHGWVEVCLMAGGTVTDKLNSKQLYQRLENHPGTPIYYTSDADYFERELLPENRITFRDKSALYQTLRMKTTAQRVKLKIQAANKDKILFTKKGIQDPKPAKEVANRTNLSNHSLMTY